MLARRLYYINKLNKQQWTNKKNLNKIQTRMLRGLIIHAYMHVPFYRKLFKKLNITPNNIKKAEDLKKIPILKKDDITKNWKLFFSTYYTNIYKKKSVFPYLITSGTSDKPLKIYWDYNSFDYKDMIFLRSWINYGLLYKDKIVYFVRRADKFKETVLEKLGFYKKVYLNLKGDDKLNLKLMNKINPDVIHSFANTLDVQSKIKRNHDINIKPKFIVSTGELLTKSIRKNIQNGFNCPIYDSYACMETGLIAAECEEKNMHIQEDNVIVRTVDKTCVVTNLANYLFPIINYNTDDLIEESEELCVCGRSLKTVKIIGRKKDIILSNKIYYPNEVIDYFSKSDDIIDYKVVKFDDLILIKILPNNITNNIIRKKIKNYVNGLFRNRNDIKIEIEKKIRKTKEGKIIRIESK